jgi:UDP-N-acetylglucosamine 1-carboxyvinyltransferase
MSACRVSYPGGCEIGPRPIDLHLKALRDMGAEIEDTKGGFIYAKASELKGCDIHLDYPSVGATENVMLASVFAKGVTNIYNAAKEPEIIDLQRYLNSQGASLKGAGTSIIRIQGVTDSKRDIEHRVIYDRIAAGTYMTAAAITGGEIQINNINPYYMTSVISKLRECGSRINIKKNRLNISGPVRPASVDMIRTLPYPGFPTDMQPQIIALLSIARGTSIVVETVFDNRFRYVDQLLRMGANIKLEGRIAVIKEAKKLMGANVYAMDLRGGAALILAGLRADGETVVKGVEHIDRGYQSMEKSLMQIGANIQRIN